MSVWKTIGTVVLAYFMRGELQFDYENAFAELANFKNDWKAVTAIIVLMLSGWHQTPSRTSHLFKGCTFSFISSIKCRYGHTSRLPTMPAFLSTRL
jgi:hypothetical protein